MQRRKVTSLFLAIGMLLTYRLFIINKIQAHRSFHDEVLDLKGAIQELHLMSPKPTVDLSSNNLKSLPPGFVDWGKDTVEILYLSDNLFDNVPMELSWLPKLKMLSFRRNSIKNVNCDALPDSIVHLILTDNQITTFSGNCNNKFRNIRKLMLARNRLESLPKGLMLPELELIRLPQNRLHSIPRELIINSPKLKWACILLMMNKRYVNNIPMARKSDVTFLRCIFLLY